MSFHFHREFIQLHRKIKFSKHIEGISNPKTFKIFLVNDFYQSDSKSFAYLYLRLLFSCNLRPSTLFSVLCPWFCSCVPITWKSSCRLIEISLLRASWVQTIPKRDKASENQYSDWLFPFLFLQKSFSNSIFLLARLLTHPFSRKSMEKQSKGNESIFSTEYLTNQNAGIKAS